MFWRSDFSLPADVDTDPSALDARIESLSARRPSSLEASTIPILAPDRTLNPWFREIVHQGTGKIFTVEDNANWTAIARPILEAFFHARFFLEMAVRYSNLAEPPSRLPSGYAAILYLYGLR